MAAAALLAAGALIGWLAASDRAAEKVHAQDKAPEKALAGGTPAHWDELAKLPFPNGYPSEESRIRCKDPFRCIRLILPSRGVLIRRTFW